MIEVNAGKLNAGPEAENRVSEETDAFIKTWRIELIQIEHSKRHADADNPPDSFARGYLGMMNAFDENQADRFQSG